MEQYMILFTQPHPKVSVFQLRAYKDDCTEVQALLRQTLTEVLRHPVGEPIKDEIKSFKLLLLGKSRSRRRGVEEDLFEIIGRLWIPTTRSEDTVWCLVLQLAAVNKILRRINELL